VCHASSDRTHRATCAKSNCSEIVTEFARLVAKIVLRAVASAAVGTVTPALGRPVVEYRTGGCA
jgi:ABC-type cobalamin transport system permease subunit